MKIIPNKIPKINSIKLFTALFICCSGLNAAALNIDGFKIALADGLSVSVNQGVLEFNSPEVPVLDCANPNGTPLVTLDPFATNINAGETLNMFWTSANAVACQTFGGGNTSWADVSLIPGNSDAIQIQIPSNAAASINFEARCVNQTGLENGCLLQNRQALNEWSLGQSVLHQASCAKQMN